MLIPIGSRLINIDHIVSVTEHQGADDKPCWTVALSNGETFVTPYRLSDLCGTIVPAPPGLTAIEAFFPEPGDDTQSVTYATTTLVAFCVLGDAMPTPISLQGGVNGDMQAVIQPDGQCVGWGGAWPNLAAFKASCEERAASRPKAPLAAPQAATPPAAAPDTRNARNEDPLTKLRAEILAAPIQPVGPDALWRDGIGMSELVAAVRDRHASLHSNGVGYSPQWGWKWGPDGLEKARAAMTGAGSVAEFERALRFLSYASQWFGCTSTVNRKRSSYSWKHVAERVTGNYVSNGMLIAAAYALGFKVATDGDSPNAHINLSEKAADLDPQKGAP